MTGPPIGSSDRARIQSEAGRDPSAEAPHGYWERIALRYDDLYRTPWSRAENRRVARTLQQRLRPGSVVLDLGCGTGLGCELLGAGVPKEYYGLDPSPAMLEQCASKFPDARLKLGVASDLHSYADGMFDLVIAVFNVMSYEQHVSQALVEIRRVLRTGGVAYLSFLNRIALRRLVRGSLGQAEIYGTRGGSMARAPVCATYSRRHLRKLFEAANLDIQQVRTPSVLAGVSENRALIPLDAIFTRLIPWLGHTNDVVCTKGAAPIDV